MKLAITGQDGFIGYHLYNTVKYKRTEIQLIDFNKDHFESEKDIDLTIKKVDVIVHLAGLNRSKDQKHLYDQNVLLSQKVLDSIKRVGFKGHLIFASSTQEEDNNAYGNAKKIIRLLFDEESEKLGFKFSGLIIPNVFGPFIKPNYNSFIATFCSNSIRNIKNNILNDKKVPLIYIDNLINSIIEIFDKKPNPKIEITSEIKMSVTDVRDVIDLFNNLYLNYGEIPNLDSKFKSDLFKTFMSYLSIKEVFPRYYNLVSDKRGFFSELIRSGSIGQVSYSTTFPGETRGDHFHTRKIERFSIINGKSIIKIRKINSNEIIEFKLEGKTPSYVDIPVWHTHNITNIGDEPLVTVFWINEFYNQDDPDTFYEKV